MITMADFNPFYIFSSTICSISPKLGCVFIELFWNPIKAREREGKNFFASWQFKNVDDYFKTSLKFESISSTMLQFQLQFTLNSQFFFLLRLLNFLKPKLKGLVRAHAGKFFSSKVVAPTYYVCCTVQHCTKTFIISVFLTTNMEEKKKRYNQFCTRLSFFFVCLSKEAKTVKKKAGTLLSFLFFSTEWSAVSLEKKIKLEKYFLIFFWFFGWNSRKHLILFFLFFGSQPFFFG